MITNIAAATPSALSEWLSACTRGGAGWRNAATGDAFTARQFIHRKTDGRCAFSVADPRKFRDFGTGEIRLGDTAIRFFRWDSATECRKSTFRDPARRHVVLHWVLRGEFEAINNDQHVRVQAGQVLVNGTAGTTIKRWQGLCEMLNVVICHDALARMLTTEFAIDAAETIRFEKLAVIDVAQVATLARYVATIISDLDQSETVFGEPHVAAQAERMLHLLFLKSLSRQYTPSIDDARGSIAPFYVRRAEAFMRRNLGAPVTMDALAAVTGVSARTLHYGFRTHRNLSPMKFLKKERLACARSALVEARLDGAKVADIAARHGYTSVSQFSRDYKALFGESPSVTVRGVTVQGGTARARELARAD